mmetsp:Transcript_13101/g.25699  ORF Transcript_13101/g.25699 Transcript_13101/m.25699 type:complete len:216 (+) Transcript_13101:1549-2196(+)
MPIVHLESCLCPVPMKESEHLLDSLCVLIVRSLHPVQKFNALCVSSEGHLKLPLFVRSPPRGLHFFSKLKVPHQLMRRQFPLPLGEPGNPLFPLGWCRLVRRLCGRCFLQGATVGPLGLSAVDLFCLRRCRLRGLDRLLSGSTHALGPLLCNLSSMIRIGLELLGVCLHQLVDGRRRLKGVCKSGPRLLGVLHEAVKKTVNHRFPYYGRNHLLRL